MTEWQSGVRSTVEKRISERTHYQVGGPGKISLESPRYGELTEKGEACSMITWKPTRGCKVNCESKRDYIYIYEYAEAQYFGVRQVLYYIMMVTGTLEHP